MEKPKTPTEAIRSALQVERHKDGTLTDPNSPGLRLVASPNSKSWIYRYRNPEGKLKQIKLGDYTSAFGLKEARAAWAKQKAIKDDPDRGDPREELKAKVKAKKAASAESKRKAYSLKDLCDEYVNYLESNPKKKKGGGEVLRMFETDVYPKYGSKPALEVTRSDIIAIVEAIKTRPKKGTSKGVGAPRIASMVHSYLHAAFGYADGRKLPEGFNPARFNKHQSANIIPKHVSRNRALNELELRKFLPWLPTCSMSKNTKDVLMLTLLTGARSGECVAVEWSEVDLNSGTWYQPPEKTKNGKPHEVMLSSQAVQLLQSRKHDGERFVFPSRLTDRHIRQHSVVYDVSYKRDSLDIPQWSAHDLRRTVLTGLARMGCPRVVQDRIANHVDTSIAAIYDRHTYDKEAREWLQKWADYLDELKIPLPENVREFKRDAA